MNKKLPPHYNPNESLSNQTVKKGGNCYTCGHSIRIRNQTFGLTYRTYIWKGTDADNDGQADWCFEYREEDWLAGNSFDKVKEQTGRIINGRGRAGDISSEVTCP